MNYFVKKEYSIVKYQVDFNLEKVQQLKREVIENCSLVVHKEYRSTIEPDFHDSLRIRNYEKRMIGVKDNENLYLMSYEEYVYPELVSIIDELIEGNPNCIDKIMNPKEDSVLSFYEEKATEIFMDIEKKNDQKEGLMELQSSVGEIVSKERKPVEEYYQRLKDLIKMKCSGTLSLNALNSVLAFFDYTTSFQDLEDKSQKAIIKKQLEIR